MIEKGQDAVKRNRIYWLDNLRTFMIFLVVLYHAGLVYESSGIAAFFWIVDDPSTNHLSGILNIIVDIFIIPTLFFIAGFFTPLSLKNKKGWEFLKSRFKRIMIPWIIAVLTLIPLYKIIFLYSRALPQESWTTYFHWRVIWTQNWLWFLPALFLFCILYLLLSKINIDTSKITIKKTIWIVFIISLIYSFFMDFFGLRGWTKTILLDFQNERILIYLMVFLLGSQLYKLRVFEKAGKNKKFETIIHSTGWIPINLYIFGVIYFLIKPGDYLISKIVDTLILRLSFVLSLAYLLYVMITTFRKYLNKQGKISKELNKNSYGVYIIHVIVVGGIALTMLNTAIPSLLKYLILTVSAYVVSNLIISSYRKVLNQIKIKSKL